ALDAIDHGGPMAPWAVGIGADGFDGPVAPLADAAAACHHPHAGDSRNRRRRLHNSGELTSYDTVVQNACWGGDANYANKIATAIAASPATTSQDASLPGRPLATASLRDIPSSTRSSAWATRDWATNAAARAPISRSQPPATATFAATPAPISRVDNNSVPSQPATAMAATSLSRPISRSPA